MILQFGKFKGRRVSELPDNYLHWLSSIDLRDPSLEFAVLSELWRREKRADDFSPDGETLVIRINRADVPLARRIWDAGHRALAKKLHPDRGGDSAAMAEVNVLVLSVREQLEALETAS
jgi:Putative quorum-sensing-regulated virulence factor